MMLELTPQGLHCASGGFHIDPTRAVENAVITHAHSDHARRGSRTYFCSRTSERLLKSRLGAGIRVRAIPFGETFMLGKARLSFHPAGHILGSAQVRIETEGEVWVVSGDYKREPDPTCEPFETVRCDVFVTEATFGTPSFRWQKNAEVGREIHEWWIRNANREINSVLFAYSLGKAQRVLGELRTLAHRPIYTDPNITRLTDCYRAEGIRLAPTICTSTLSRGDFLHGELILIPPSKNAPASAKALLSLIGKHETAFASGWIARGSSLRGGLHGSHGYDQGFQVSDHADWDGLVRTIRDTSAREIYVLHRGNGALVRHLNKEMGIRAFPASALLPGAPRNKSTQLALL